MTDIATVESARVDLPSGALEDLRAEVRGAVLEPADPGQQEVRAVFNAMHPSNPALTVRCSGTADVIAAVNFARKHGLTLAVRGGGHSIAGLSAVQGGMLLDLAAMRGVHVDSQRQLAVVQGGALWADVDRETQAYGLVAPGGVVSDTGVAGLTLGGGYGWVRRKYGLSVDALVEAQVVCADGQVRTASADSNPDLFWALRGGGGNFGVVTSFTFALQPLGPVVAFSATFYPVEEIAGILRGWREFVTDAPDDVTSVVVTITFPANPELPEAIHDREVAIVAGVYAGDPEDGLRVMAPLRELGTPLFDMSGPTLFTDVQSGFDPLFPRQALGAYWKSQYLDELSDGAIDVLADLARNRPAPLTLVNVFHMGGAIAEVDPEATAFSERAAPFMVSIDGMWDDPADDADTIAWVRSAWDAVGEFGNGGVYLNFTGLADEARSAGVDTAFGRNLERLAQVKATYDADNFFHVNNNIQPA
jgi:FAD binding domain/Berberine and berberine like